METQSDSSVSEQSGGHSSAGASGPATAAAAAAAGWDTAGAEPANLVLDAADRLFFSHGFGGTSMDDLARELGMSKKTIYRYFPGKRSLLAAVLDRQFARIEETLTDATASVADRPFDQQVERFLIAAGGQLSRIGARQLLWGRGDPMLRPYVEQRVEDVVYRRIDSLFRTGHERGLLPAPPELLSLITRGALERLLESELPHDLDRSAADLLRATIDVVLHGALRSAGDAGPRADSTGSGTEDSE
jgi:AcrR family transcriptional regulator